MRDDRGEKSEEGRGKREEGRGRKKRMVMIISNVSGGNVND